MAKNDNDRRTASNDGFSCPGNGGMYRLFPGRTLYTFLTISTHYEDSIVCTHPMRMANNRVGTMTLTGDTKVPTANMSA